MITADYIAIILMALAIVCGIFIGFGKGLQVVTKGIIGIIISFFLTWFFFGIVLSWGFVQNWLAAFVNALEANGSVFCKFLLTIRIDMIVLGAALFGIMQILRILVLKIIASLFESKIKVMVIINKTLGVILFAGYFLIIIMIFFQITFMISGTSGQVYNFLQGSFFGLDKLYVNNPLNSFITIIRTHMGI